MAGGTDLGNLMKILRHGLPVFTIVILLALIGPDRFDWRFALVGFLGPLLIIAAAIGLHTLRRRGRERRGVF